MLSFVQEKISILFSRIAQLYQDIKTLEQIPFRRLQGDFEVKREVVRAPRKNKVSVEDLRPPKKD